MGVLPEQRLVFLIYYTSALFNFICVVLKRYYLFLYLVGSNSVFFTIEIQLLDVNDNLPRFDPESSLADKNENEINYNNLPKSIKYLEIDELNKFKFNYKELPLDFILGIFVFMYI